MDITAIKQLTDQAARRFVPSASDYQAVSPSWEEAEYRHYEAPSTNVVVGFWTGAPGKVALTWPYTEVCSMLSGRVAVRDQQGGRVEFGAGQAFMVPKGFVGDWITLESACKIFVAIC